MSDQKSQDFNGKLINGYVDHSHTSHKIMETLVRVRTLATVAKLVIVTTLATVRTLVKVPTLPNTSYSHNNCRSQ